MELSFVVAVSKPEIVVENGQWSMEQKYAPSIRVYHEQYGELKVGFNINGFAVDKMEKIISKMQGKLEKFYDFSDEMYLVFRFYSAEFEAYVVTNHNGYTLALTAGRKSCFAVNMSLEDYFKWESKHVCHWVKKENDEWGWQYQLKSEQPVRVHNACKAK